MAPPQIVTLVLAVGAPAVALSRKRDACSDMARLVALAAGFAVPYILLSLTYEVCVCVFVCACVCVCVCL